MGAQGTATLDFGAFPGSSVAYVDVVAAGVISTSAIEAWIRPVATADHTDMDHIAVKMEVRAMYVSDGNIRIFGTNTNDVIPPREDQPNEAVKSKLRSPFRRTAMQNAPMLVGTYSVWWVWN